MDRAGGCGEGHTGLGPGSEKNPLPVEALSHIVGQLPDCGVGERDVELMIKKNPAWLPRLGLDLRFWYDIRYLGLQKRGTEPIIARTFYPRRSALTHLGNHRFLAIFYAEPYSGRLLFRGRTRRIPD